MRNNNRCDFQASNISGINDINLMRNNNTPFMAVKLSCGINDINLMRNNNGGTTIGTNIQVLMTLI